MVGESNGESTGLGVVKRAPIKCLFCFSFESPFSGLTTHGSAIYSMQAKKCIVIKTRKPLAYQHLIMMIKLWFFQSAVI